MIDDYPLLAPHDIDLRRMAALRKRAFDVALGSVLSLLALPVIAVLAFAVAVTLHTWPFFVQRRPGTRGHDLVIVKLRTLPTDTPRYASKFDLDIEHMALPWLCAILRRSHLDELPQLLLTVTGQMSLVGPRPRLPDACEPVEPWFDAVRTLVRQGCTGLWQISRSWEQTATSAPAFDLFYLRHASVRLDLWIVARTVGHMLGVVRPIDLGNVPRWALGRGLVPGSVLDLVTRDAERVIVPDGLRLQSRSLHFAEPNAVGSSHVVYQIERGVAE